MWTQSPAQTNGSPDSINGKQSDVTLTSNPSPSSWPGSQATEEWPTQYPGVIGQDKELYLTWKEFFRIRTSIPGTSKHAREVACMEVSIVANRGDKRRNVCKKNIRSKLLGGGDDDWIVRASPNFLPYQSLKPSLPYLSSSYEQCRLPIIHQPATRCLPINIQ